jgi:hypothetical protein
MSLTTELKWTDALLRYAEENLIHEWRGGGYIVEVLLSSRAILDKTGWTQ